MGWWGLGEGTGCALGGWGRLLWEGRFDNDLKEVEVFCLAPPGGLVGSQQPGYLHLATCF